MGSIARIQVNRRERRGAEEGTRHLGVSASLRSIFPQRRHVAPLGMGCIVHFRVSSPPSCGRDRNMRRLGAAVGVCVAMAMLLAACANSPGMPRKDTATGQAVRDPVAGKPLEPAAAPEWVRVERVALAVFRGGRALCGHQVAPTLGLAYANRESFNPAMQPAADKLLGFDEHLKVTRVVEGS